MPPNYVSAIVDGIRQHGLVHGFRKTIKALMDLLPWRCIRGVGTFGGVAMLVSLNIWRWCLEYINPWSDQRIQRRKQLRQLKERDKSFIDDVVKPAAAAAVASSRITPQSAATAVATAFASRHDAKDHPVDYFFGRLPYELRHEIQRLAFPPRTLHMCLEHGPPALLLRQPRHNMTDHIVWDTTSSVAAAGESGSIPQWVWYGCVCISLPPDTEGRGRLSHGRASNWWRMCVNGPLSNWIFPLNHTVRRWLETDPDGCTIGITGWLLSCRQAYVEGMRHLYTQNTIAINSPPLLRGIQDLVSPSVTSLITSLDISWKLSEVPLESGFVGYKRPNRSQTSKPIFPSLEHLRITFLEQYSSLPDEPHITTDFSTADLNAWMARRLPPVVDAVICRLTPPSTQVYVSYTSLNYYRALDVALIREQGMDVTKPQICRVLGGLKCWRQMPHENPATVTAATVDVQGRGYWCHVYGQVIFSSHLDKGDYDLQELYRFRTTRDLRDSIPHWRMIEPLPGGSFAYSVAVTA